MHEWGITTVKPSQFKAQMLAIKDLGFSVSTIRDSEQDEHSILVTFDDGYENVYQHAAPVMQELDQVATVFAITEYVGRLNQWDYFPEAKQVRHMDWNQLRELSDRGWEIGSHGCTHKRMVSMPPAQIRRELEVSKEIIQDKLGRDVVTFCPPFNAWNSELLNMIEDSGYKYVAISYPLNGLPRWGGRFVPRLGVYLHDMKPLFRSKLTPTPLSPLTVLQQQLINLAGDGKILENWLRPIPPAII